MIEEQDISTLQDKLAAADKQNAELTKELKLVRFMSEDTDLINPVMAARLVRDQVKLNERGCLDGHYEARKQFKAEHAYHTWSGNRDYAKSVGRGAVAAPKTPQELEADEKKALSVYFGPNSAKNANDLALHDIDLYRAKKARARELGLVP